MCFQFDMGTLERMSDAEQPHPKFKVEKVEFVTFDEYAARFESRLVSMDEARRAQKAEAEDRARACKQRAQRAQIAADQAIAELEAFAKTESKPRPKRVLRERTQEIAL